jgi:hypothetical protein
MTKDDILADIPSELVSLVDWLPSKDDLKNFSAVSPDSIPDDVWTAPLSREWVRLMTDSPQQELLYHEYDLMIIEPVSKRASLAMRNPRVSFNPVVKFRGFPHLISYIEQRGNFPGEEIKYVQTKIYKSLYNVTNFSEEEFSLVSSPKAVKLFSCCKFVIFGSGIPDFVLKGIQEIGGIITGAYHDLNSDKENYVLCGPKYKPHKLQWFERGNFQFVDLFWIAECIKQKKVLPVSHSAAIYELIPSNRRRR